MGLICQKTVVGDIVIRGVGLHSGKTIEMTICPAPSDFGIVFRRTDIDPAVDLKASPEMVNDTRLATTLNVGSVAVSTIEHLMASLNAFGIDNARIDISAPETPIMDGSAQDFVRLLEETGTVEQDAPRRYVRIKSPVRVTDGDKWAELLPYDGYRMEFTIAFGHPAVDATVQHADVDFRDQTFTQAVSNARTFGFLKDIEWLRAHGLCLGGSMDNAVVVDAQGIVNPEGLRRDDEFVKHKMLDAMGDLYVLGHPLLAHYRAFKSGHGLNNQLLRELIAQPQAWEMVELEEERLPLRV